MRGGEGEGGVLLILPLISLIRRCQSLHNTDISAPSLAEHPRSPSRSTHGSLRLQGAESERRRFAKFMFLRLSKRKFLL